MPGRDITPKGETKSAEPPFNRAVRGETDAKPEVLNHNLNFSPPRFAPDGSVVVPSRAETTRQQALEDRFNRIEGQRENDGGRPREELNLNRDFHDSRDDRR